MHGRLLGEFKHMPVGDLPCPHNAGGQAIRSQRVRPFPASLQHDPADFCTVGMGVKGLAKLGVAPCGRHGGQGR
jgi:hypothetical protein